MIKSAQQLLGYDIKTNEEQKIDVYEFNQQSLDEMVRKANVIATQLAPILDRFGRLLIDLAPHFAILG